MTTWTAEARAAAVASAEVRHGLRVLQHAKPTVPTGETGYSGGPSYGGVRTFSTETDPNTVWYTLSTRWSTVQRMVTDPGPWTAELE